MWLQDFPEHALVDGFAIPQRIWDLETTGVLSGYQTFELHKLIDYKFWVDEKEAVGLVRPWRVCHFER